MELDPVFLLVAAGAFFAGSVVKGVTGMGMPLVAITLMATVIEVRMAVPLIVIPAIATNIMQIRETWRFRVPARRAAPIVAGIGLGTTFGAYFVSFGDPNLLQGILGIVLVSFCAISFLRFEFKIASSRELPAGLAAGSFTGVIGGMTGVFGPVLAIYMLALNLAKNEFVWLMGILMLSCSIFLGGALGVFGGLGQRELLLSFMALLPGWAGMKAGAWIRANVSADIFRKVVLAILALMGVRYIVSAFA